jgi:hypothetical protein
VSLVMAAWSAKLLYNMFYKGLGLAGVKYFTCCYEASRMGCMDETDMDTTAMIRHEYLVFLRRLKWYICMMEKCKSRCYLFIFFHFMSMSVVLADIFLFCCQCIFPDFAVASRELSFTYLLLHEYLILAIV